MISSLIEARSCERFRLLADACDGRDRELARLHHGLWASEHGHYLSFLQLARQIQPPDEVARRWQHMLDSEAKIIQAQPPGPRMHSGAPPPRPSVAPTRGSVSPCAL
jgi:tRNA-(ms[2]io[6]A)-hydroxylase